MKKIMDKHPMLILLMLVFAAAALGAYQYYPIHLQRQSLKQTLSRQEMKMDEIQDYSERLPMLYQQVKGLEPKADEFSRRFPEDKGFSGLWQQIAEIMDRNHLSDQLVRPGQVVCSEEVCSIPLEIECSGTFADFFEFFRALEQYDRLIRMDEVHLRNDSELSGQLRLHARARVFYRPGETQK